MKTILTVDDSASVRQLIKIALGGAGFTVVEAGDGSEGLTKARNSPIDLGHHRPEHAVGDPDMET